MDALLVWVKYVVKYIHIRIMFLMRDKFMLINNEQSLKATLTFLAKLEYNNNIQSIYLF